MAARSAAPLVENPTAGPRRPALGAIVPRDPMALAVTAAGLLALIVALLVRPPGGATVPSAPDPSPVPAAVASTGVPSVRADAAALRGLFGAPPATVAPPADRPQVDAPPPTRLNLRLLGVLGGPKGRGGSAIVRTEDGIEQAYSVGETIANGVVLQRVYRDRVVISRAGAHESILLPDIGVTPLGTAEPRAQQGTEPHRPPAFAVGERRPDAQQRHRAGRGPLQREDD